ncbi:hypothetical protein [Mesobacillus boroniphilus]|uniref:hypothetical protein n=1 Tax=Mesobacillus boroniphilus TaxID=308892 RepID=UPI0012E2130A|nr:hypothetical protein [Mesobacillus boroniphilus]
MSICREIIAVCREIPAKGTKKSASAWSAPTSVGGRSVKSLFDFIGRTETSRGARRWS